MPRNGSGTYELPLPDVTAGTSIQSSWANTTLGDIATALTNSIAKDGETVWTGADDHNGQEIILDVDGDTSITADTDDQIDFKIGGADRLSMTNSDLTTNLNIVVYGDRIEPLSTADMVELGRSTRRWNNVWATAVNAGTLTLGSGSITDSSGQLVVGVPTAIQSGLTTGTMLSVSAPALTTGTVASLGSSSSSTSTRNVLSVLNTSSAATGTALINLQQDADAPIIRIAPGTSSGSGVTTAITTRTTPGSIAGFMQITVAGNKRWIAFYNDPS